MTRTTVSAAKPDKTDTGEWIDIHSHVGRLMSTLMAGGRPFSIDATSAGMTIITRSHPSSRHTGRGNGRRKRCRERNRPGRREDHQQEDADTTGSRPNSTRTSPKENSRKGTLMERIRGIVIKTLTILAGFWLADLAASRIQAGIAADESLEQIMDDMTTMLQHPTDLGFDRTSLLCGLGGACASACSTSTGGA